jgi:hypothetical protein
VSYPKVFTYGTGVGSGFGGWDTDDDEALNSDGKPWYWCAEKGHKWVDTGMKWTYCSECNVEGEWTMAHGYGPCTRKK